MERNEHKGPGLRMGELARRAGIGRETIRYYERRGLLADPPRGEGGFRLYPETAVARLRFIRRAKELGFSLREIGELLALQDDPAATCCDIRQRAERKQADIERKIGRLQRMHRALALLLDSCTGSGPVRTCPIIEALSDPGNEQDHT